MLLLYIMLFLFHFIKYSISYNQSRILSLVLQVVKASVNYMFHVVIKFHFRIKTDSQAFENFMNHGKI